MLDTPNIDGAAMVAGGNKTTARNAEKSATLDNGKSGQVGH